MQLPIWNLVLVPLDKGTLCHRGSLLCCSIYRCIIVRCSRINQSTIDCRTFWPCRPSSAAYKQFRMQLAKAWAHWSVGYSGRWFLSSIVKCIPTTQFEPISLSLAQQIIVRIGGLHTIPYVFPEVAGNEVEKWTVTYKTLNSQREMYNENDLTLKGNSNTTSLHTQSCTEMH